MMMMMICVGFGHCRLVSRQTQTTSMARSPCCPDGVATLSKPVIYPWQMRGPGHPGRRGWRLKAAVHHHEQVRISRLSTAGYRASAAFRAHTLARVTHQEFRSYSIFSPRFTRDIPIDCLPAALQRQHHFNMKYCHNAYISSIKYFRTGGAIILNFNYRLCSCLIYY